MTEAELRAAFEAADAAGENDAADRLWAEYCTVRRARRAEADSALMPNSPTPTTLWGVD